MPAVPVEEQNEKTADKKKQAPPKPKPKPKPKKCGHTNRHVSPPIQCELIPNHEGNHRQGGNHWKDLAGTPVSEIVPEEVDNALKEQEV